MGNRGNIELRFDSIYPEREYDSIYFYSHWSGTELPEIAQAGLAKKWRWNDATYLARILFCELVKGEEADETGYGINPYPSDGAVEVVIDTRHQTVELPRLSQSWPFSEYIALPTDQLHK